MDEVEWTLECVTKTADEVVMTVNAQTWKSGLDPETLRDKSDVRQWYAESTARSHEESTGEETAKGPVGGLQFYSPKCIPACSDRIGVYYIVRDDAFEILAVQVPNTNDQDTVQIMAMDALSEFDQEILFVPATSLASGQERNASLFNLLNLLLKTSTPEQSAQITHSVYSFLQSEITVHRLYSQLTSIVGYTTLRKVVNQLDPENGAIPNSVETKAEPKKEARSDDAQKSAASEMVSLGSLVRFKKEHPPGLPTPLYAFDHEETHATFYQPRKIPKTALTLSLRQTDPWHIDLPSISRIPHRVGSVMVAAADYLLLTGGVLGAQHSNSTSATGWSCVTIIEQRSFRSVDHDLSGPMPQAQFGTGTLLLSSFGGVDDCLAVFGGAMSLSVMMDAVSSAGRVIQPCQMSNELKALDLNSLQWSHVPTHDVAPPPRCFPILIPIIQPVSNAQESAHSAPTYEAASACLLGGLGRPERPTALDDCWLLSSTEGTVWRQTPVMNPEPLWGAIPVSAGVNKWLICGGYGSGEGIRLLTISVERGRPKVVLTPLSGGLDPVCGRRCFGQGVLMKCVGQSFTAVEVGVADLLRTSATAKNLLFLVGGTCEIEQEFWSMSVFEVISGDGAEISGVRYVKTVWPQNRPMSTYQTNPRPRVAEAGVFASVQPVASGLRLAPTIPLFFISGGFTVASTRSVAPLPLDFTNTQLITLHSVDPFRLEWSLQRPGSGEPAAPSGQALTDEDAKIDELRIANVHARKEESDASEAEDENLCEVPSLVVKRGVEADEVRKMFKTLDEQLRHYPNWLTSINYTPSLLSSLGSTVPWPFTAIGNLLENSCHLTTRATDVSVDIGLSKSTGQFFLAFSDDGRGLGYSSVHKLLKRFGVGENRLANVEHHKVHQAVDYGLGFKVAASRLGQGCLVVSRTSKCLGVALLSQRFLKEIGAGTAAATPACFWKLPQRDTIIPQQEHLLNQQKIFKFSPFKRVNALAEQINLVGLRTGTRVLFFDRFSTWCTTIGVSVSDGFPRLIAGEAPRQSDEDGPMSVLHLDTRIAVDKESGQPRLPAGVPTELLEECPLSRESYFVTKASVAAFDAKTGLSSLQDASAEIVYPLNAVGENGESGSISADGGAGAAEGSEMGESRSSAENTFPLWTDSAHSLDLCLPTYMFWALLFNAAKLRCCGWQLVTSPDEDRARRGEQPLNTRTNPFDGSLYRFLKRRLHGLVELDWLFSPEDSGQDAFGLLGFINPLDTLIATDPGDQSPLKYQEAGILLYYRERLIRRLFVPFPAAPDLLDDLASRPYPKSHFNGKPLFLFPCTGIIHVPEWLHPTMNKDEFVANRSAIFDEFIRKVKQLVTQYLSVCLDEQRRRQWIDARGQQFLEEAGRRRPLSPLLHVALLKKPPTTAQPASTT